MSLNERRISTQKCAWRRFWSLTVGGLIIARMVINMNEARLTTIAQVEEFLNASACIEFNPGANDSERYAHISAVLERFDYLPAHQNCKSSICHIGFITVAYKYVLSSINLVSNRSIQ
jgi:hypothetical protein